MPIIGYLSARSFESETPLRMPFLKALETAGFVLGRNIAIEYRFAEGREDRLPLLAAELLRQQVALLTAFGRGTALAAKAATTTVPIVFASGLDPVRDGLVASLNRPGGNATGVSLLTTELGPKRLTLVRELLAKPGIIAFVVDPKNSTTATQLEEMRTAAQSVGQPVLIVEAHSEDELGKAFAMMSERNVAAILSARRNIFKSLATRLRPVLAFQLFTSGGNSSLPEV